MLLLKEIIFQNDCFPPSEKLIELVETIRKTLITLDFEYIKSTFLTIDCDIFSDNIKHYVGSYINNDKNITYLFNVGELNITVIVIEANEFTINIEKI